MRDELSSFQQAGAHPLGVNPASAASHARYAERMAFGFPLLSDAGRSIARAYGALKAEGEGIQRTVYAIRRDGTIAFAARGAPLASDIVASLRT